jgi:hypothetical protein
MPRAPRSFRGINRAVNRVISTFDGSSYLKSGAFIRARGIANDVVNSGFKNGGSWAWGRMGMYGGIGAGVGAAGGYVSEGDLGGAVKGAGLGVLAGGIGMVGVGAYNSPRLAATARRAKNFAAEEWASRAAAGRRTAAARARTAA